MTGLCLGRDADRLPLVTTTDRSWRCPRCHGTVAIPARSRSFTTEQIEANHAVSCPGAASKTTTKNKG